MVRASNTAIAALLEKDLSYFDISPQTGFLDIENTALYIPSTLPEHKWEDVLAAAKYIWPREESQELQEETSPGVDKVKTWRNRVHNMQVIDVLSSALIENKALLRRAHVVLCMVGHFYIHGAPNMNSSGSKDLSSAGGSATIPSPLATPWLLVSTALGLKPVLSYVAEVMWNCASLPLDGVYNPNQLKVLETFTGHSSEIAFITAPARVELEGAAIVRAIFDVFSVHLQGSDVSSSACAITDELLKIEAALRRMKDHLLILKKDCSPAHFYWKLRPWIAGSGPQGWIYQLGAESQVNLTVGGSTAGSSSLLQALDSFLGLELGETHLNFRRSMQDYMPQGHRRFLQTLEGLRVQDAISPSICEQLACELTTSPLRIFVQSVYCTERYCYDSDTRPDYALQVGLAYNNVLRALKEFRDEHFRIVSLFIINQASKSQGIGGQSASVHNKTPLQGTGGSDLAKLLKGYRDSSHGAMLSTD